MGQMLTLPRSTFGCYFGPYVRKTKSIVVVVAFVLLGAVCYLYCHTRINVTEPCRRNAAGEEVCPPPYKPCADLRDLIIGPAPVRDSVRLRCSQRFLLGANLVGDDQLSW
jgi:hypothetical protein